MPGRHGRVRREHRRVTDLGQRQIEARAVLDQIADPLQDHEGGVALVQMEHAGLVAQRLERPHSADAQDDLLLDARLAIAAVEPRGELAIPRRVFLEIRVEEVERDPAEAHAPDGHQDRPIAQRNRRDAGLALGRQRMLDGRIGPVEALVALFLPSFGGDVLVKVALAGT